MDTSPSRRALMVRLVEWVERNTAPPPSRYPRIDAGTLVPIHRVAYPPIPQVPFPRSIHTAYRTDYGPRWAEGIIDLQPPRLGLEFPMRVSQVDAFGNEMGGVRSVELRAPLATYTPWTVRTGLAGGNGELHDFGGNFIPLPKTDAAGRASGDPRPSIKSLYGSRGAYLDRVREAGRALMDEGLVLSEDLPHLEKRAGQCWDWILAQ